MSHSPARLAVAADARALTHLINSAYRVEAFFKIGDRIGEPEVRTRIEDSRSDFLVIDAAGTAGLVGAVYVERGGTRGHFGLLSVDPELQGTGLGRALVEAAEAYHRALGSIAIDIEVVNLRTELPSFYAKFGFTPTGVRPFPAPDRLSQPVHLVVMSKALPPGDK